MLNWLGDNADAVVLLCWLLSGVVGGVLCWPAISNWRYRKQFRRHLRMSAVVQARYAVYDSWVRSGGADNDLAKSIERTLLNEYRETAKKNGDEYYSIYALAERDAHRDLMAVHRALGLTQEKGDEKESV